MVRAAPGGHHIAYEPLPTSTGSSFRGSRPWTCATLRCPPSPGSGVHFRPLASDAQRLPCRGNTRGRRSGEHHRPRRSPRLGLPAGYVPAFIKIDAEGAEAEVIAGGLETIRRTKPIVVFEHGKGAADAYGTTPSDVFDLLCAQAGLRLYDIDGAGPLTKRSLAEIYERNRIWTFSRARSRVGWRASLQAGTASSSGRVKSPPSRIRSQTKSWVLTRHQVLDCRRHRHRPAVDHLNHGERDHGTEEEGERVASRAFNYLRGHGRRLGERRFELGVGRDAECEPASTVVGQPCDGDRQTLVAPSRPIVEV